MTVDTTDWTMISDITPESAYRQIGSGAAVWRLSWLPDRPLTREQALAGMELDEILSDPDIVHDRHAHADAAILAGRVGIIWEQAVILLSKRVLARLRQRSNGIQDDPVDGESTERSPMSPHGTPWVFR
ncbi:hypothetical protein [Nocardia anaemiae]|uniref:hypothetical protein n=1 Tax=Nocardia anaemiae TaxID=263910 RepID=UPI0007C686B7|nr:hypothetical protein [Nocardia anaemiae]